MSEASTSKEDKEQKTTVEVKKEDEEEKEDENQSSKADPGSTENMEWDGQKWIYVDPVTKTRMTYDDKTKKWLTLPNKAPESDRQLINGVWVHLEPTTRTVSIFDARENKWVPQPDVDDENEDQEDKPKEEDDKNDENEEDGDKNGDGDEEDEFAFQLKQEALEKQRIKNIRKRAKVDGKPIYIDAKDGTIYEYDWAQGKWFPQVDDDFLVRYQANYGNYVEQPKTEEQLKKEAEERAKADQKEKNRAEAKRKKEPEWFDIEEEKNCNVYVTGLPTDITIEEYTELMSKCGVISLDPKTRKPKLKLYMAPDGIPKGDGLCCYYKRESVDLALKIIDGAQLRSSKRIKCEVAKFTLKGDYDPSKKKKMTKQQKKDFLDKQQKLLDWRPEKMIGERPKSDSVIVLTNVFDIEDLIKNPGLVMEIEDELKATCSKFGVLKKVVLYDNNPEGVVTVSFTEPRMADDCITMMNFKIFQNRTIKAATWDGKTKYKVEESEEVRKKRQKEWSGYLHDQQQTRSSENLPTSSANISSS